MPLKVLQLNAGLMKMHNGKSIYLRARVCYIVVVRLWANDLTSLSLTKFINVRDRDCRSCVFHLRGQFCNSFIHVTLTVPYGRPSEDTPVMVHRGDFCANNHNNMISALRGVSTGIRRDPDLSWGFHEATWRREVGWSDHCLSSGDKLPVFESDFLVYQLYDLGQIPEAL